MANRERIIEGTWTCSSCQHGPILGRLRECPSCRNPREQGGKESELEFGAREATGASVRQEVTDPSLIAAAESGPDWFCGYCETANPTPREDCQNCGAPRGAKMGDARVGLANDAALSSAPTPPQPPAVEAAQGPPGAEGAKSGKGIGWGCGLVLLFSCCLCTGVGYWGSKTRVEDGRRVALEWERAVEREVFTPVTAKGWKDRIRASPSVMPVNGEGAVAGIENIRDCQKAQRGTEQVRDGFERVCHTKSRREQCGTEPKCEVKDLGNGFAKETCDDVPKYCDRSYEECESQVRWKAAPKFAIECTYDSFEWKPAETLKKTGTDATPTWPEPPPVPYVRERRREEKYRVRFEYGEKKTPYTLELENEAQFKKWSAVQQVKLTVTNAGQVKEITPQ